MQRQKRSIDLGRGLFLLRYERAADERLPPEIEVQCEPGAMAVLPPGEVNAILRAPGTTIVLLVERKCRVGLELFAQSGAQSIEAELTCEPLKLGLTSGPKIQEARADETGEDVSLLAHVAKLGDVAAANGTWVAGPTAPSRIEGFSISWPNVPRDVQLRYAATCQGQTGRSSPFVGIGDFAGTRRQARPIIGVDFDLQGPGRARFSLEIEALFLGSPVRRMQGERISLSGPTGREPLIGLKVDLQKRDAAGSHREPAVRMPSAPQRRAEVETAHYSAQINAPRFDPKVQPPASPAGSPGRVRVFRV